MKKIFPSILILIFFIQNGFVQRKSGLEMVYVQGGFYQMGGMDDVDDGGPKISRLADECPHGVFVKDFFIGKYEVTQSDWLEVMGTNPSKNQGCLDCPVEQVSWNDIQIFIDQLNRKSGKNYRLPTEEEWEYAAKGGICSETYMYAGSNKAELVAWFTENSKQTSQSVGSLQPNELGIYDMSGNIWEWCSNIKSPYPCDRFGKIFNTSKVLRGGSFSHRMHSVRVIDRNGRAPSMRLPTLGFRLVMENK